jgi:integrase
MTRRSPGEGSITRRTDSRWQASWTVNGKRHFLYAPTRPLARERLAAALRDRELGLDGTRYTVAEYAEVWLRDARRRLAPRTHERYAAQLRLHLFPTLGAVPLKRLTHQQLGALYDSLTLEPASIRHLHRVISAALDQAVRWDLIVRNPAKAVRPPKPRPRRMEVLTPDETRALLGAVEGDELEALYVLAVMTGMRQGELLALRWRDIHPDFVEVGGTMYRGERLPTKTAHSTRRIRLNASAIKAIRKHRLLMAERLLRFRARTEDDTLVFVNELGEPYNGSHITERHMKPLLRRAGLREIRFHDLRHACASLMLSQGVRVEVVSKMLGHSTPAITLSVYAHLMPGDEEDAVARLDAVLGA